MEKSAGEREKNLGNECYKKQNFEDALVHYNEAIKLEPNNHVYYSNKSAVLFNLKRYSEALEAVLKCMEIDPTFVKGYSRLVLIYKELGDIDNAIITQKKIVDREMNYSNFKKYEELISIKSNQENKEVQPHTCAINKCEYVLVSECQNLYAKNEYIAVLEKVNNAPSDIDQITKSKILLEKVKALKALNKEFMPDLRESIRLYPSKEAFDLTQPF
ncbi:HSP70-interacting protein, putative [Entamoeba invadens IP1]|uniref:HSP70-interacting protein, putative n=1 Tax=Entamoeba invadens IP1 TaxID=370355 RepID=A0A0A1U1W6_ENTIV|nr:HSP70-interacting protein, putative [Entamoeba invadens IP1]ELP88018.1 HSP70-interacting protein, putative [Entamoeba invadens IP1]|eukprot:XP_004254789.1 HSP70-interacting protein, putative [Entamoeba invadens IP1]